jgi:L-rhamnose mutarotase
MPEEHNERRVMLTARLRPESVETYLALHRNPDPAILAALPAAGHRDYRIFRQGTLLVASFTYAGDDLAGERARLRARPDLQDWMARTAACQEAPDGQVWTEMQEIFRLPG